MSKRFDHDEEFARTEGLDFGLWRRIAAHTRPYRRQLGGLAGFGAILAAIETLMPMVTGRLVDAALEPGSDGTLLWLGGLYAVLIAGFAVLVWAFIVMAGRACTGIAHDLRRASFDRLQELSFSYFDVRPTGWLVSRLTSDCSKISSLVPWFMLDLAWGVSLLIFVVIMMLWLHVGLALAVLAIVPPLVFVSIWFQRRILESSRLMRRSNAILTASFTESITGVRTTKTLVREEENLAEFTGVATEMQGHSLRNMLQSALYLPIVIALGSAGVGIALWRGGVITSSDDPGGLTPGVLIAFMQYATLFYMPIQELARRFTELQAAQAAAERVQGLLETVPEIADSAAVTAAIQQQEENPRQGAAIDGGAPRVREIEFRDVSFWYQPEEPVLTGFNLRVKAGQTIALVGATGGGKSTIVSLAARFYEPCAGSILVDGVDYRERSLHWLQSRLGVVLQHAHLFAGTIAENIRYGRLDATDDEVADAARVAGAHGFIVEMEDAYGFEVGEGGVRLSTGERQLVTLARAVLADPDVFIMDEATSSVDTETERLIQTGIERVLEGRIAFVIAHRLSTIRRADEILVIDQGVIVERGTHDALIQRGGRYHALYTRQLASDGEAMTV